MARKKTRESEETTEGKIEDRSENRMRFSERSRICLMPRRGKDKSKIFPSVREKGARNGRERRKERSKIAQKIACDFLSDHGCV